MEYSTPAWAVHRLLDDMVPILSSVLSFEAFSNWVDPCVGYGGLVRAAADWFHVSAHASPSWRVNDVVPGGIDPGRARVESQDVSDAVVWIPDQRSDRFCIFDPPLDGDREFEIVREAVSHFEATAVLLPLKWGSSSTALELCRPSKDRSRFLSVLSLPDRLRPRSGPSRFFDLYAWYVWSSFRGTGWLASTPSESRRKQASRRIDQREPTLFPGDV